jgi:YcxB-like protein
VLYKRQFNAVTTIVVRYQKSDFIRLGLHAAFRSAKLKWAVVAVAVAVFGINVYQTKAPWEPLALIATFLTTALFVFGYLLLILPFTVLSVLVRNRRGSPAAEVQTYSLTDLGLTRKSDSSETLLKWGGARSVHRNKDAIYVATSASSYLILPRRSFVTDTEYESIWKDLQRLARIPASQDSP